MRINHNQKVSSHLNVNNWDILSLVHGELSHLLGIILNLMEEHLSLSESSCPSIVHDHLLDSTVVLPLADEMKLGLLGHIDCTYWSPSVEPNSIINSNCEVVGTNADVVRFDLEISLSNDHVVAGNIDD